MNWPKQRNSRSGCAGFVCPIVGAAFFLLAGANGASAQAPTITYGSAVSSEVKQIYERGLRYLAATQKPDGSWGDQPAYRTGVTGMCLMAFLAGGDDPNFGRYADNIRRATRSLIESQDTRTGYIPSSMYNHGFAALALAEAYGAVDEEMLWADAPASSKRRSLATVLDLAVRCAVTSQKKNSFGGWRYSPDARDADTSVSGAVLVSLLACRNAGIEVPDDCIDRALAYYRTCTIANGIVAYSSGMQMGSSMNRSSIATLVYAIGKKKDWKEYHATLGYISKQLEHQEQSYPEYFRYYMAQALFQGDVEAWAKWNGETTRLLRGMQRDDGSFQGMHGEAYGTSMSLLALALNFRFLPIYER